MNRRLGWLSVAGTLLVSACGFFAQVGEQYGEQGSPRYEPVPYVARDVPGGEPEQGKQLMQVTYGCGACHVIPGVPGATGKVGPPLDYFAERVFIAGQLPNTPDNLVRWIRNPQSVEPGTAMPDLGVSEPHARDIAAYLLTLR
jgi:cytochrome c2